MKRKQNGPQSILVLIAALLLSGCPAPRAGCEKVQQGTTVHDLIDKLEMHVNANDFKLAIELLESTNVSAVFERTCFVENDDGSRRVDADKLAFLAYNGHVVMMPGVPRMLRADLLARRDYLNLPGTDDVLAQSDEVLRRRWMNALGNVALRFNARVYVAGVASGRFPEFNFDFEETRRMLFLDEATWNELPIEVQVTLQEFVNERFSPVQHE